jgi:hypothetical protein
MQRYVDDYDKPITATAQCTGVISMNPLWTKSGYNTNGTNGWWNPVIRTTSCVRTVGVKGYRPRSASSDSAKKLDYLLERFVASGPVSLAWELVPFSFVLDWFVDLSAVIGAVDNFLKGSPKGIYDCWWSEKSVFTCDIVHKDKRMPNHWVSRTHDGVTIADNDISYYRRFYLNPVTTIGLSSRFGKKQAAYSAALLYQLVANLGRK